MSHSYYKEDQDNPARLRYFDEWFKSNSQTIAKERGMSLNSYLSQITNITSFKAILQEVFSLDASLANYVSGFDQESFDLFYNRPVVQDIVRANKMEDEGFFEELKEDIPLSVEQIAKETAIFFKGEFIEKETGKTVKVIAKEDEVTIKGKKQTVYRDARGRFVKKV